MKKTKVNEKAIIFDEANYLYHAYYNLKTVSNMNFPGSISSDHLGFKIPIITRDEYLVIYDSVFENNLYMIEMVDGSLVCFAYDFDRYGKIIEFCLSFLPNPDSTLLNFSEVSFFGDYYLRIDFSPKDSCRYVHPAIHLHSSLYKSIRFPLDKIVTPFSFLYLIVRYVYNCDEDCKLLEAKIKRRPNFSDSFLSDEEKEKLVLNIL